MGGERRRAKRDAVMALVQRPALTFVRLRVSRSVWLEVWPRVKIRNSVHDGFGSLHSCHMNGWECSLMMGEGRR
jgi:hypothetical protein